MPGLVQYLSFDNDCALASSTLAISRGFVLVSILASLIWVGLMKVVLG